MRINLRRGTLAALATAAILAVLTPIGHGGVALSDPVCPRGTNWDNVTHTCH